MVLCAYREADMRKLNLGCGPYHKQGYINIDVNPNYTPDMLRDVRRGLPFDDDTVDEVWTNHFLEHLTQAEVLDLLEEVYRVLINRRTLTVGVPIGIVSGLDHLSYYSASSFDGICRGTEGRDYYRRNFQWEIVSKDVIPDDTAGTTSTLLVVMRPVKAISRNERLPKSHYYVKTVEHSQRFDAICSLIPEDAKTAIDIGCADSFRDVFIKGGRMYSRVIGINIYAPFIAELAGELRENPAYEFAVADAREWSTTEQFDVATILGVAEHFTLYDLSLLLDRLAKQCRTIILETPEQYEPNEWAVKALNNPFECHLSLVTAEFLAQWDFAPAVRYWVNDQFSDCIYVRSKP